MKYYRVSNNSKINTGTKTLKGGVVVKESDLLNVNIKHLLDTKVLTEVTDMFIDVKKPVISDRNNPKWKYRLAIVTGVWKRPEIFEIFAAKTKKLKHKDLDIIVIVAGSEGEKSRSMVEKHGFKYLEIPNQPLAHKMNCTTILAGHYKSDYVLCVGSDDIISQGLLDIYAEEIKKGTDYVGVLDWYFYDTKSKKYAYWGGYIDKRKGHTCGAGRLISARIMELWEWQPWEIKHSSVLDNSMQQNLSKINHTSYIFKLKERGVYGVDIKSPTNMTPFELWDNTVYIEPNKDLKKCVE